MRPRSPTSSATWPGERLTWSGPPVLDKHSVGGLPGNRTRAGLPLQWVVAVHAVADPLTAEALEREARVELVTCNTIPHPSNRIDVLDAIRAAVERRIPAGALAEAATASR
jgi:hypothetical protein